jgi:hypothetical protein
MSIDGAPQRARVRLESFPFFQNISFLCSVGDEFSGAGTGLDGKFGKPVQTS